MFLGWFGIIFGIIAGGVITWGVARRFYQKAANDLALETSRLRQLNELMLQGMEHAGWIRINRDGEGNIVGFEKKIEVPPIKGEEKWFTPAIRQDRPSGSESRDD